MSLDAAQYDEIAQRLAHALKITRLVVERGLSAGGQLCYRSVGATELLGRLMQMGYRVSFISPDDGARQQIGGTDPAQRNLRLVDSSTVNGEDEDD